VACLRTTNLQKVGFNNTIPGSHLIPAEIMLTHNSRDMAATNQQEGSWKNPVNQQEIRPLFRGFGSYLPYFLFKKTISGFITTLPSLQKNFCNFLFERLNLSCRIIYADGSSDKQYKRKYSSIMSGSLIPQIFIEGVSVSVPIPSPDADGSKISDIL
jgi:hypothetical protein